MKNYILLVLVACLPLLSSAQFMDNFTDGDFSANPTWTGDATQYIVNATNQLQLNNVDAMGNELAGETYLSTAVQTSGLANWEFYVLQDFSPSASNHAKVYLSSDNSDFGGPLNGYYIKVGGISGLSDALELFRQDGTSSTLLISGSAGSVSSTPSTARVRVERDNAGNWILKADYAGGTSFVTEGTATDNTYTTGNFIGVWCKQTATRFDKFYFDDFSVDPVFSDMTPPMLVSTTAASPTQIDLEFDEPVDQTTAETVGNYSIDNAIGNPASALRSGTSPNLVTLTLGTPMTSGVTYNLDIINVEDLNGNAISNATPEMASWLFIQTFPAAPGDLIINEIFADESPQVGLPLAEFVEIYNNSTNFIDLDGYSFSDASTSKVLSSFVMSPSSYLILCDNSDITAYSSFGDVLGISSMPSLNNSGDSLTLTDGSGVILDKIVYNTGMYQDVIKDDGGWSLELINLNLLCIGNDNWIASNDASGGTPGTVNSVYNNTPDTTGPTVVDAIADNGIQITLTFNEALDITTATNTTNYTVDNGISINNVVLIDPFTIQLNLNTAMVNLTTYTVTANSGLTDCSGNSVGTPNSDSFTFYLISAPNPQDIIINEIMADPTPVVGTLPEIEFVELYNRTIGDVFNLEDMDFEGVTLPYYLLLPGEYVVLHDDILSFPSSIPTISFGTFTTFTNAGEDLILLDAGGGVIDEVIYDDSWYQDTDKDDGGWSLELINPELLCTGGFNWIASNDVSGGTPGAQNSVYDNTPDLTGPTMSDATANGNMQILVIFDEALDVIAAVDILNYGIDNGLSVTMATLVDPVTILLDLDGPLTDMTIYLVTANAGLTDCSGNAIGVPNSATFTYYDLSIVQPKEIIINEIMADPKPAIGLPEYEYVELFNNTTNKAFSLENMDFEGKTLPAFILLPGEYVILHDEDTTFAASVPAIAIASMPSFTDSGEDLILLDEGGNVIDEVIYDNSWYRDTDKDNGGYSLELINPNLFCKGKFNWIATNSPIGGTPGTQNSVYDATPDLGGPNLLSASYLSNNEVVLEFDDVLDEATATDLANYAGIPNVIAVNMILPDMTSVVLVTSTPLTDQTTYTVIVTGVTDCLGNLIDVNTASFQYFLTVPAARYDILINEIMADISPDPLGLPAIEYIEIYNRTTNKAFNLLNMEMEEKAIPSYILLPGEYVILHDNDTTFDASIPAIAIPSFPSITDSGEDLILTNESGQVIDAVVFSSSWYGDSDRNDGGWSLERVNPNRACEQGTNWRVTEDLRGGTPGEQNSNWETTPDDTRPDLIKVFPLNDVTILLTFSEGMDEGTATDPSNYSIDNGIGMAVDAVLEPSLFNTVTLTLGNPLDPNTRYVIEVTDLNDCEQNAIGMFNTADLALPELMQENDLIINEVLYNPLTGGKDFVELYNRSNKVLSFNDLFFASRNEDGQIANQELIELRCLIFPGEYVAFTEDPDLILSQYETPNPQGVLYTNLPTYGDDEGDVIIFRGGFGVIDEFHYTDEYEHALLDDPNGVSLERIDYEESTQNPSNWHSAAASVGFATPAYENSQYTDLSNVTGGTELFFQDDETFSPDGDDYEDFLLINYNLSEPGYLATINIFDAKGRPIKKLVDNELLAVSGAIKWDGDTDTGEKARIGLYVIYAELFHPNGDVKKIKKPCVVAGKL